MIELLIIIILLIILCNVNIKNKPLKNTFNCSEDTTGHIRVGNKYVNFDEMSRLCNVNEFDNTIYDYKTLKEFNMYLNPTNSEVMDYPDY